MPRFRDYCFAAIAFLASLLICVGSVEVIFAALLRYNHRKPWEYRGVIQWSDLKKLKSPAKSFALNPTLILEMPRTHSAGPEVPLERIITYPLQNFYAPYSSNRFLPNATSRALERTESGRVVFDFDIHTDSLGRRLTLNSGPLKRKKFAMMLGCSFTFGQGVRDEETIASQLAKNAPGFNVYNYAQSGNGPQEVLSVLKEPNLQKEIPEKDGIGIYLFIRDHVFRALPSASTIRFFAHGNRPYFEESENGNLEKVRYADSHPIWAEWLNLLAHSSVLDFYRLDYPFRVGKRELQSVGRLIQEMSRVYQQRFGNDKFYVVMFPEHQIDPGITPLLDSMGIKYLNYGDVNMADFVEKPTLDPNDLHPSAESNAIVAKHIAQDLGLSE